jgi:hypothetical protein
LLPVLDGKVLERRAEQLAGISAVENDFGAVFEKTLRKREANALRRTGDEPPPACQVEQLQ